MSTYDTALLTDSTCDIPADLLERYHIDVVPQIVIWGEQELRDRIDIQPEEFYRRLAHTPQLPTTSQPSVKTFVEAYQGAQEQGAREIVVVTISSAMSGTCQAAQQAADLVTLPVHVVDAKGPTLSLGWQTLAAARARECGGDAGAMIAAAAKVRQTLVQFVYLDTLEYLHKGGRIGGAARFIGAMLDLKPLVQINHRSGLVEAADRVRTRRKGVDLLYQRFFEGLDTHRPLHVAVLHGDARSDAEALAERIRQQYAPAELLTNITGPVLGLHTGPRALALCGYTD
jgi:DegV family protein with EDD domain